MAGKGYINKINSVEILHRSKVFGYAMNASGISHSGVCDACCQTLADSKDKL